MMEKWKLPLPVGRLLRILEEKGYEAYVVGGCVRDLYMGRFPHDWDICTNASPLEVIQAVRPLPVIETGLKHGTVTVLMDRVGYEVTTYRTEGTYSDGRHPDQVVFVKELREDLKRRDFTMNAMAYNPREGFVDLFGGREDLSRGLVRCVGEAKERFSEDVLRIMRAVRFASVFSFSIEEETKKAIHACVNDLPKVSVERITTEFRKMVMGRGFAKAVREFPDLFCVFLPQLSPLVGKRRLEDTLQIFEKCQALGGDELTLLGAFFLCLGEGEMVDRLLRRLKFDNLSRETVVTLVKAYQEDLPLPERGKKNRMRRLLGRLGEETLERLFLIWRAELLWRGQELSSLLEAQDLLEELLRTEGRIQPRTLAMGGKDLLEMGVPQGKGMGECLSYLLDLVLDGEIPNEGAALREAAEAFLKGEKPEER